MIARRGSRQRRMLGLLGVGLLCVGLALAGWAGAAAAQLALPVNIPSLQLGPINDTAVYTIDLDTLPPRPSLIVEVERVSGNLAAEVEVELSNFSPTPGPFPFSIGCPLSPGESGAYFSDPGLGTGSARLEADLYFCDPDLPTWDGIDADVIVRATSFGGSGLRVNVRVRIRAISEVPNGLLLQQVMGPQTQTSTISDSTVIYRDDSTFSNGAGEFLWAGTRVEPIFVGPFSYLRYQRKSLLRFRSFESTIPSNAIVTDVDLDLFATNVGGAVPPVDVFAIVPGPFWSEGSADATGGEFFGAESAFGSPATWIDRDFGDPWVTPGGDTTTPPSSPLASNLITTTGPQTFRSPGLTAAVQDMVTDDFSDGLLLSVPATGVANNGVQFASDDNPEESWRPSMTIDFFQPEPFFEGIIEPDMVDFTNEGEDWRWVYDLDGDGIFTTGIGGVCETIVLLPGQPGEFRYPYTYTYTGAPGYTGLDCCTWRIVSEEAGDIVGSGQALFFHNLDPFDPANIPPDSDGDGIVDSCDNCQWVVNGPSMGSCMTAGGVNNGPCESDLECGAGETCQKGQQDGNGDFVGDACAVPEPGTSLGLVTGVAWLACLRRRARRDGARSARNPRAV